MKRTYLVGFAFGIAVVMGGCSDTPVAPPDNRAVDEKAIRAVETQWVEDFKARDADKIAAHYADGATVMAPGQTAMKGKDAIAAGLKGMFGDKNFSLSFTTNTVEASKSGDIAYSQGTFSMTMTDAKTRKPEKATGSYVTVYKKQADGGWKAIEDINTNDPPPPAPAKPAHAAKKAHRRR